MHGYGLTVKITFETDTLDGRNWVVDFGELSSLKQQLAWYFDHKTVVANDDPEIDWFSEANAKGIIDLILMDNVGCEMFAEFISGMTIQWLADNGYSPRVWVKEVEVQEHGGNSATISYT